MARKIQFTADDRKVPVISFAQIVPRSHPVQLGRALQILLPPDQFHVIPCRAAASVSIAEGHIEITATIPLQTMDPAVMHRRSIHLRFIEHVQKAGNHGPIDAFPEKSMMWKRLRVIVGPVDFLGGQPRHAKAAQNLRERGTVSERIREPCHPAVHTEHLTEIFPSVEKLTDKRFAAGHIGVRFDPHAPVRNPLTSLNGFFYILKQVRIVLPAQFIFSTLALNKQGFRVFLQQPQLGGKRACRLSACFPHRPQPGQIQMGIGNHANLRRKGPVMRLHEGRHHFPCPGISFSSFLKRLLHIQIIQHALKACVQRLPESIILVEIIMHVPEHRQVQPELIRFLIPQTKCASAHHRRAFMLITHPVLRKNRTSRMRGERCSGIDFHRKPIGFTALCLPRQCQIRSVLMGMRHSVSPTRTEGFSIEEQGGFPARIQIHDHTFPADGRRKRKAGKHPGIFPRLSPRCAFRPPFTRAELCLFR